jgi:hypothetical protein
VAATIATLEKFKQGRAMISRLEVHKNKALGRFAFPEKAETFWDD